LFLVEAGSLAGERDYVPCPTLGAEQFLDIAGGLTDALFVFDKSEANILIAIFAEAHAGGDADTGFLDQQLGELQ
jgi:hypothetical protein